MSVTAFDLVRLLPEIDRISASKTDVEQKKMVLSELLQAVPAPVFCAASAATRDYVIKQIEEALNECSKETKSQIPINKGAGRSTTKGTKEELLFDPDGDAGRQSVTAAVVKKTTQKRRTTKRSA